MGAAHNVICPHCGNPLPGDHTCFLCPDCEDKLRKNQISIDVELASIEILQEFLAQVVPAADYFALVRHGDDLLVCINDKTVTCHTSSVRKRLVKKNG